jgi:sulfide dehydrogenase cytochrome subunit
MKRRDRSTSSPRKLARIRSGAFLAALAVATAAQAQAPAPAEQFGKPIGSGGAPPPGASSCSGCHPASGSVDTPVKQLVGRKPEEIVAAVEAFRSGAKPATVMDRIAKGFTGDEVKAIADWYGAQRQEAQP